MIPIKDYLIKELDALTLKNKNQQLSEFMRVHSAGSFCERKIWQSFRLVKQKNIPVDKLRIFERGHIVEKEIIEKLEKIPGLKIESKQSELKHDWIKGHFDLVLKYENKEYVGEIKSANRSNFLKIFKNGTIKEKPEYYIQIQLYMHLSGICNGFIFVHCKDNEEIYIEEIEYNPELCEAQIKKLSRLVYQSDPPPRISKEIFHCRVCEYHTVCYGNDFINKNCRTCSNSEFKENNKFYCNEKEKEIAFKVASFNQNEEKFCPDYSMIEDIQTLHNEIKEAKEKIEEKFGEVKIYES